MALHSIFMRIECMNSIRDFPRSTVKFAAGAQFSFEPTVLCGRMIMVDVIFILTRF
jgi:hypothetical protein